MTYDLHLPAFASERAASELGLMGLLVRALLEMPDEIVHVEMSGGMVLSNNKNLSQVMTMLARAKRLPAFFEELSYALFSEPSGSSLGVLAVSVAERNFAFRLVELRGYPDFKWRIEPIVFGGP